MAADVWLPTATFVGGAAGPFFMWLRQKRRAPTENMRNEVAAAKDVNDMALATLQAVQEELQSVTRRLEAVEAEQEKTVRELGRIGVLFREAVEVLRGVIEAAKQGRVPDLALSSDLLREIKHVGVP